VCASEATNQLYVSSVFEVCASRDAIAICKSVFCTAICLLPDSD
jgi:hypothetical protein